MMKLDFGKALQYLQYVPVAMSVLHTVQSIEHGESSTASAPLSLHGKRGRLAAAFKPDAVQNTQGALHGVNAYIPVIVGLISTLAVEAAGYTGDSPLEASVPMSVHGVRGTFSLAWISESATAANAAAPSEPAAIAPSNSFGIPDGHIGGTP